MTRFISALILAAATSFCAAAEQAIQLVDKVPLQYTVVRGDTLWGVSAKFLQEPWRWPEIWRMNQAEIKNPHRIYPGDVIVLDRDDNGNPFLRKQAQTQTQSGRLQPKVYVESIDEAIPPIPPNVIEPFISEPLVIEAGELDKAARITATQQDRVFLGAGDAAYVDDADPSVQKWQIYRNGKPLLDPVDPKKILGYEAFYLGSATQVRAGQPATFKILSAKQEIGHNDRLIPFVRQGLANYLPHKPSFRVDARIVSVYGGVGSGGRSSIISLSQGRADGFEIGHVVALERDRVVTEQNEAGKRVEVVLPSERFGLAFVFRTFEHISYALVMQSEGSLEVGDLVHTP